jgi:hypothetical protein
MLPTTTTPERTTDEATSVAERRQVQADFEFVAVDGTLAVNPTVRVRLWGARGRAGRGVPFRAEVLAVYRDLVEVAKAVLPPVAPGLYVDVVPAEAALFERTPGRDEVRLRLRAFSSDLKLVKGWARAFWAALRAAGAKVEPAVWPQT